MKIITRTIFLAYFVAMSLARTIPSRLLSEIKSNGEILQFYERSFLQLQVLFSDNSDCRDAIEYFQKKFKNRARLELNAQNRNPVPSDNDTDLETNNSAQIGDNTATVASSGTVSSYQSIVISGSKGQFVRDPIDSGKDSMRVYTVGELMIEGVVTFVQIQSSLSRNDNYFIDVKINEHNEGLIKNDQGIYIDSKTISRKIIKYDKKIGFGVSEVYIIGLGKDSVDFKIYTVTSASSIKANTIVSAVIIELKHILIKDGSDLQVEQATLTTQSVCGYEDKCQIINLGNIKINGDLLSKIIQAKSIVGVDYEKKVAVIKEIYKLKESASSQ